MSLDDGIFELCEEIDAALMDELKTNTHLHRMYKFFDSAPWKPLNPREFYEFIGAIRPDEYGYYLTALD
ncbi:hypothetical protein SEA_RAVENPUFF_50 [Streptomyces phage RavenPuff]|nr:hypothetical protein SEA_RAVENPUFF_50 [Streptomyces phage RavenPuff]UVK63640.1 hypothetical protein SEA_DOXI13_51 [Streptomyces phage Doxi13]